MATQVGSGSGIVTYEAGNTTGILTFAANSIQITNVASTVTSGDFEAVPSTLGNETGSAQDVNYQYNGSSIPAGNSTVYLNPTANVNPIGASDTNIDIQGGDLYVWNGGGRNDSDKIIRGSMTYRKVLKAPGR